MGSPVGEENSQDAAKQREQHAFRQKLADNAHASGAESEAHRHFLATRGGAGEHQAGDVGAGDEQDDSDREHQDV